MACRWTGNTFQLLGYDVTVYQPTAQKTYRMVVFDRGSEYPVFAEYFSSEEEAKEAGLNFIIEDAQDELAGFGYKIVKEE